MNRPKVTKEMILEAALAVSANIDFFTEEDAEVIARHYRHPMDGYQLARELDRREGMDFTMIEVQELDNMSTVVSSLHKQAEKRWVAENDIKPQFPVGIRIKQGVIDSVCKYSAAKYIVKEDGCTRPGRFLLIPFEDAVPV